LTNSDARDASGTDEPIEAPRGLGSRFLRLALPNALANLTVPLAGLVDTAMLGHLGEIHHLAGVGLGSIIFDYVYWTFGFLRMGTTGLTAQAMGRGDREEALLLLLRALGLAVTIALALLLLQAPLRDLGFAVLSGETAVEGAGRAYYDARIWGAIPTLANFAFLGWFLGRERAGYVLVMTLVANGANIALDYVFIVRLGLEAYGAGLATMLSQYLMLAVALIFLARERPRARGLLRRIFQRGPLIELLKLNRDILIRTFCLITAFSAFTNLSAVIGTGTLAANLILLRIVNTVAHLIDGGAFATESLAGIFKGRGDIRALRRLLRLAPASARDVLGRGPRTGRALRALPVSRADLRSSDLTRRRDPRDSQPARLAGRSTPARRGRLHLRRILPGAGHGEDPAQHHAVGPGRGFRARGVRGVRAQLESAALARAHPVLRVARGDARLGASARPTGVLSLAAPHRIP
jgi:MATE family multidrug resistance protein